MLEARRARWDLARSPLKLVDTTTDEFACGGLAAYAEPPDMRIVCPAGRPVPGTRPSQQRGGGVVPSGTTAPFRWTHDAMGPRAASYFAGARRLHALRERHQLAPVRRASPTRRRGVRHRRRLLADQRSRRPRVLPRPYHGVRVDAARPTTGRGGAMGHRGTMGGDPGPARMWRRISRRSCGRVGVPR
jgi:hypothetical protein